MIRGTGEPVIVEASKAILTPEELEAAAKVRADALTVSTATLITTCTTMATSKANWIRTEVANSKRRINDSIARLAATIDPAERASIEAEIESEKGTIDGWVVARPVDAKRVAEVIARDRKNAGVK
jgi:hypothetical protein